ncbi:MAG: YicC family protein [Bacteroidaceae bacterium]|nr:YicC family protein [Bacteroidaceae bacterium]MBQ2460335.1 YicC family protein [Bacteroidaceae bacterium]MBQ2519068.1 YicC family protein [Bacteroidaceae bacterium]MBQ3957667.1 YicC family protein [Bacteroidaceae bacterium]
MILSMTGYGKASAEFQGKKITAEAKSLNSKALDLSTRIAPLYREKELELRAMIAQTLERGKVDFSLWIEQEDTAGATQLNGPLIESYRRQIRHICDVYSIPQPADWWATLLRMPDVTARPESQELSDEEWAVVKQLTEDVIGQLMEFRRQEGAALEKKFSEKLDNIESLLQSIEPYEKERTARIRQRIIDSLQTIPEVETDRNRLEQEMIYYIEKLDISEEKQRLANHLRYFRETMATGHGQGKKLGFIAQEMGREINTTGSKSNQAEMQNIVVRMKDELEQIKEQVLNVM